MYDEFSGDYDRFVEWPSRLAAELPLIERELQKVSARRVLDSACGTGMHAIALGQRGYQVAAADLSAPMIERAQLNATAAGVHIHFRVAGFGEISTRVGTDFDALLCLGNSLPHVLTPAELQAALVDFAVCLRPGGLLLIQNRNYDAVLAHGQRWMEPQAHREGDAEWLFLRFYDFGTDGTLTFNLVTLQREGAGRWNQRIASTRLRPLRQEELAVALGAAGFTDVAFYGDMNSAPFDPENSGDLIITASLAHQ